MPEFILSSHLIPPFCVFHLLLLFIAFIPISVLYCFC
nr:MAG TPA: hypothetical protein [Caudoviricetes sp.]